MYLSIPAELPPVSLMLGDCLERMAEVPDGSVDMVLADPPYGTTQNPWDAVIPLEPLWTQWRRVCKRSAAVLVFSQMPYTLDLILSNRADFRYQIIWVKSRPGQFLNVNRRPMAAHEEVNVFYAAPPTYNPQMTPGEGYTRRYRSDCESRNYGGFRRAGRAYENDGWRYPTDVIQYKNDETGCHPTQKPVALLEYFIKTYSNPGETVLDSCMGSGSTGVACVNTGRAFIGVERDPGYYATAQKRIAEAQERATNERAQIKLWEDE